MSAQPWDLLVVGGGTAGIVGANAAASFGARVLLVERDRTGGDCLWTGCVPSKALLAAAGAAAGARGAARLGVHAEVRVDFAAVMAHVRGAVATIAPVDSVEALEAAGVAVVRGDARFVGPRTVLVDGVRHEHAQALVAVGSAPALPDVPGLAAARPLTSDTVWELDVLPGRLTVLGGGAVGCELAQAFARLGSVVTLLEAAPRLLGGADPAAAALVAAALRADGVDVRTGVVVTGVQDGVVTVDGSDVPHDALLVATGRTPRTAGLGLEHAGVALDDRGYVRVDAHLRTTNPRVWAAGDVTGHPALTHVAGVHASLAASNAVLGLRRSVGAVVPRVAYTSPEVGTVGRTTGPDDVTVHHEHVDRAVAEGTTVGFTRLALDGRGRVVGATVVGPRAGETLGELTLAVQRRLRTRDLAGTTHAYPTWSDGAWNAAIADVRSRLAAPAAVRGTRALAGARRRWLARG